MSVTYYKQDKAKSDYRKEFLKGFIDTFDLTNMTKAFTEDGIPKAKKINLSDLSATDKIFLDEIKILTDYKKIRG